MRLVKSSLLAMLVIDLLGSVTPAYAEVVTNVQFPINWLMTTSQCPALPADVTGNGRFHSVFSVTQDANGGFHLVFADTAHGRATDTNGGKYAFNYANHLAVNVKKGVAVNNTDSFTLEEQGGGGTHINVRFVFQFVVNANGTVTVDSFKVGGDLGCDPI